MATARVSPTFQTATAPGCPYSVEYSPTAMEEIRETAVEGFRRVRHGGVEVGGVLFGQRNQERLLVLASRRISCEHLHGPSFILSEQDLERLQSLLDSAAQDASLAGMEAVGWYHTHTRSDIALTTGDREVHDRFFPQPWQAALVLKPDEMGDVQGAFFFREGSGLEIAIPAPKREQHRETPPESAFQPAGVPPARHEEPRVRAPRLQAARAAAVLKFQKRRSRVRWWLAAGGMLFAAMATVWFFRPAPRSDIWLRTTDENGLMRIDWNRDSAMVQRAAGARLGIQDGEEKVELELDAATLHNGNVTYQRRSRMVGVRLIIPTPGGERITVNRFVGQPPPAAAVLTPLPQPSQARAEQSAPVNLAPPVHGKAAREDSAKKRSSLQRRDTAPRPPRTARAAQLRTRVQQSAVLFPEPRPIVAATQLPNISQPRTSVPAPQPAARSEAPAEPARRYDGPRAGRVIWTGRLRSGDLLEIERGRPSRGALTGQMPPVPVQIRAHPAELKDDGMIVYGPERPPEKPGPANGWNRTQYRWNRKHARDLTVLEQPAPGNHWNRMVLRGEGRELALIVIDWEVIGK